MVARTDELDTYELDNTFYLYGHVHGEKACYRNYSSGAVLHIDENCEPIGDNLNEKNSRGKEYAFSIVHMGGLRPYEEEYFEDDGDSGYGGLEEYTYYPKTATPTLAQFLVFEVYSDRVVFHIRNTGSHELYNKNDKLEEYTVFFV